MAQAVFTGPRIPSNHRRRTAARQPLPLKAHPTVTKLESWEDFQRIALFPGAPFRPFALDDDFRPFLGGDPWLFEQEGYVATIFGNALPHLLLMASERRWKHKPACGGWLHANLFTKADLEQGWADLEDLKRRSSISLCELLGEELRVYFRLLRAAQRGWWYNPGGFDWEPRWRSANRVLERILHICAELRRRANRWFAELCLRQELFGLWRAEFGPNVELTDEAARWIGQEGIPEEAEAAERAILYRLLVERKAGHAIPLCCRWLVRLWEQDKVYQEVQVA